MATKGEKKKDSAGVGETPPPLRGEKEGRRFLLFMEKEDGQGRPHRRRIFLENGETKSFPFMQREKTKKKKCNEERPWRTREGCR